MGSQNKLKSKRLQNHGSHCSHKMFADACCSKKVRKIHRKTPVMETYLSKTRTPLHLFSYEFHKFSQNSFLQNISGWLLQNYMVDGNSTKIATASLLQSRFTFESFNFQCSHVVKPSSRNKLSIHALVLLTIRIAELHSEPIGKS